MGRLLCHLNIPIYYNWPAVIYRNFHKYLNILPGNISKELLILFSWITLVSIPRSCSWLEVSEKSSAHWVILVKKFVAFLPFVLFLYSFISDPACSFCLNESSNMALLPYFAQFTHFNVAKLSPPDGSESGLCRQMCLMVYLSQREGVRECAKGKL